MASKPKIYWDSCAWIGLINQEADKFDALRSVMERAQKGEVEIWTSTLSLAEVFKKKCEGNQQGIAPKEDTVFEDFLSQPFIVKVALDSDVGTLARRLLRKFPKLAKPADAVHLATAVLTNVDEVHTFDGENLLNLDGQVLRQDGKPLKICTPQVPAPNSPGPLFETQNNEQQRKAR